ncbi:MAG TPA: hypothetical protein DDW52_10030 [Planctomycetaceae bacterium]|nr:hypothetical protein [Planctomycetaceae bacterium]
MEKQSQVECPNCGMRLDSDSRYCPACGQKQGPLQTTLLELIAQVWAATFDVDNKFWRTWYTLFRHPGKLTVEYYQGRRNYYIRPAMLVLLASGCFFIAVEWRNSRTPAGGQILDKQRGLVHLTILPGFQISLPEQFYAEPDASEERRIEIIEEYTQDQLSPRQRFLTSRLVKYTSDERLGQLQPRIVQIGSRSVILLLPCVALFVYLLHVRQKQINYVDSVIFTFHIHSFAFTALAACFALPAAISPYAAVMAQVLTFVHWYRAQRIVYRDSRAWAVIKTLSLMLIEMLLVLVTVTVVILFILVFLTET